jgi:hypothetical protein
MKTVERLGAITSPSLFCNSLFNRFPFCGEVFKNSIKFEKILHVGFGKKEI